MIISKAYDYYLEGLAQGDSKEQAIKDAAHVWNVDKDQLQEYAKHWDSLC